MLMMSEKNYYKGKLNGFFFGKSSGGFPQFEFKFIVEQKRQDDGEWVDVPVFNRTIYMILTENNYKYRFEELRWMGFESDDLSAIDDWVEQNKGKELTLASFMKANKDGSGERENWEFATKIGSGGGSQELKKVAKDFNSLWKATKKPSAGTPKPVEVKVTDDYAKQLEDTF